MALRLFLDFDGTITTEDVGDALFQTFGAFEPHHGDLLRGHFSVAEYYRRVTASIPTDRTLEHLQSWAETRELDPGFVPLVRWAHTQNIPVTIVSDGFDVYIEPILALSGVRNLVEVSANRLITEAGGLQPVFPGASEACSCFCASCKRNAVITRLHEDDVAIYVGDGRSDACAVGFADVVFAKGTLAAACTRDGIPHHHYHTLSDVLILLQMHMRRSTFRQRRRAVLARKRAFEAE